MKIKRSALVVSISFFTIVLLVMNMILIYSSYKEHHVEGELDNGSLYR